jgi:hypothetical protein
VRGKGICVKSVEEWKGIKQKQYMEMDEITDSKLSIFKIGKSECDINNV